MWNEKNSFQLAKANVRIYAARRGDDSTLKSLMLRLSCAFLANDGLAHVKYKNVPERMNG